MTAAARQVVRLAWPTASVDHLLRAVAHPDAAVARDAWRSFAATADFDALSWGAFRLVGLAARRIGELDPGHPLRPRIAGIERSLWTRSQMTIGTAGPALAACRDAAIALLAIKGAARAARRDPAARGRVVNDIDLVVRPADLERAFDLLVATGWTPAGSGSPAYQRTLLAHGAGTNFVLGRFGNVDLHRTPFHAPHDSNGDDAAIWQRAAPGLLGYAEVLVPSPTDSAVIAIAHGALDAHKSSDWLVDLVAAIDDGVDWDLFTGIVGQRRLVAAAAIALTYVDERLGRPLPGPILAALAGGAIGRPLSLAAALAETRPKERRSLPFALARLVAKQWRLRGRVRHRRSPLALARPVTVAADTAPAGLRAALPLPGRREAEAWSGRLDLTLAADLPKGWRRVDFEINAGNRHLARLRGLAFGRHQRRVGWRFRLALHLADGDPPPTVEAVPSRSFNDGAPPALLARYGAVPFVLAAASARADP